MCTRSPTSQVESAGGSVKQVRLKFKRKKNISQFFFFFFGGSLQFSIAVGLFHRLIVICLCMMTKCTTEMPAGMNILPQVCKL